MDTRLDDLPTLTPKQTAFVNALLQGKTAGDAYREAYNCERMSQGAISVELSPPWHALISARELSSACQRGRKRPAGI
jgi:hypothetical protein